MTEPEYVLGTGDDELSRLALQNRLWSDAAVAAWRLARLQPGERVLDIGCGPGFAMFDLAALVTRAGAVVGVDESPPFVRYAQQQAAARHLPQVTALAGDVQQLPQLLANQQPFDVAYARWVLCFVNDPSAVIAGVRQLLRPGGRLVVHDYFNYQAMTMAPRKPSHDAAVEATMRSWRRRGGDPDVGGRLPQILAEHDFELIHVAVHQRIARGGETMFAWPDTWWRTFAPKLVAMGELRQDECTQLLADLDAIRTGHGFIQCPPVYELIAIRQ